MDSAQLFDILGYVAVAVALGLCGWCVLVIGPCLIWGRQLRQLAALVRPGHERK